MDKNIYIVSNFVSREISVLEFEREYLILFKRDNELSREAFELLNGLFVWVDAFCGDPEIANYPFDDIDEEELHLKAKIVLDRLKEL